MTSGVERRHSLGKAIREPGFVDKSDHQAHKQRRRAYVEDYEHVRIEIRVGLQ